MDKTLFYARERLLANDLNQTVTDTEDYGEDIVNKWLTADNNVILTGIVGSGNAPPDNKINMTAGIAYHKDGRKVETAIEEIVWSDIDPNALAPAPHLTLPRIDVVVVRHQSINTSTVTRYFIDVDPASPTYGQSVPQTVVTEQEDFYQFDVIEGTPGASPAIPAFSTDTYIPLYLIYIHSQAENVAAHVPAVADPTNAYIQNTAGTGWSWGVAWRADLSADIDPYYYQDLRRKALATLEDKSFEIPVDENVGAGSARADVTITPDWSTGSLVLSDTVDVRSNDIISTPKHFGTGLDDLATGGDFTGTSFVNYRVEIDGTGAPDTFRWSDDGGSTWDVSGVAITGAAQTLNNGVTVTFTATIGHTANDYWDFFGDPSANQPVYGPDGQSSPIWENFIFGKITDVTPGSETVTFYRGNSEGTLGVDYWASNCNVDITLTYPLHVSLHNLPEDVFRNQFQTGMIIDMNIEKRLEDIEDGTSGTTYFLKIDGTNEMLAPITFNAAIAVPPFVVPASASGKVINLNADRVDDLHVSNTGTSYIPYVNGTTKMVLGSAGSQIGVGVTPAFSLDIESGGIINVAGLTGRIIVNQIGAHTGSTVTVVNSDLHINQAATTSPLVIRPPIQGYVRIYPAADNPANQTGYYCYYRSDWLNTHHGSLIVNLDTVALASGRNGTGIYKPLQLLTGGATRVRIETSGYVGINNPGTAYWLDVNGDGHFKAAKSSVSDAAAEATLYSESTYAGVNYSCGIWAESVAAKGRGIYGRAVSSGPSTDNIGVKGYSEGTGAKGVMGQTNTGYGVYGLTISNTGVVGAASSSGIGVRGYNESERRKLWYDEYGDTSAWFDGSIFCGQERWLMFYQEALPSSSRWIYDDTSPTFPGQPYYSYQGCIQKNAIGTVDAHSYFYYPMVFEETSTLIIPFKKTDDEIYFKVVDENNNAISIEVKEAFADPWSAAATEHHTTTWKADWYLYIRRAGISTWNIGTHVILCFYLNKVGGGFGYTFEVHPWMYGNHVHYSPWIVNKFLASTNRNGGVGTYPANHWSYISLGDGTI